MAEDINKIFSEKAIADIERVNALLQQTLTLTMQYNKAVGDIGKSSDDAATKKKKLTDEEMKQAAAVKELDKQRQAAEKALQKQLQKEAEYEAAIKKDAATMDDLRKQNKALAAERDKVSTKTEEGRKRIAELNKQMDENNKVLNKNSSELEKQKINIGNYISAWGPFQGIARTVSQGVAIMKVAFASLKAAIISTGIGALVVAVASLATYFSKTERGAEALRKIMAGFQAVFKVLIDRVIAFGEGLFKIFSGDFRAGLDQIGDSFKGITSEIREEYELARKLREELEAIEDARRAGNVEQARLRKDIQATLEIARSEEYTAQERLKAWEKANKLSRENLRITEYLNQLDMDNLRQRVAMGEADEATLDKIAELQAKMYSDEAAAQSEINSLMRLGNKLRGEAAEEAEKLAASNTKITEARMIEADAIDMVTEKDMMSMQMRSEFADLNHQKRMEQIDEERQAQISAAQFYADQVMQIGNAILQFRQIQLDSEMIKVQNAKQFELDLAKGNAEQISAINEKYAKKERDIKLKQAKQNKTTALFNAIIGTAQAVINGLATMPFFPLGIIMGALAGVLGAVQIGLIASQPLPAYAKGTRRAKAGRAIVGEKGRELIFDDRTGQAYLTGSGAHMVDLGRGGQRIFPSHETEAMLRAARSTRDDSQFIDRLEASNARIVRAIRDKSELHIYPGGRRIVERKGQYYRTYMDKQIYNRN